jgi:hypothetical protein
MCTARCVAVCVTSVGDSEHSVVLKEKGGDHRDADSFQIL